MTAAGSVLRAAHRIHPPGFQSVRLVPIDGSEELAEPGVHLVEAELRRVEVSGGVEA